MITRVALVLLPFLACGCGASLLGGGNIGWLSGSGEGGHANGRAAQVRWRRQITPDYSGAYIPVETSSPVLDPSHDRIYVGSSAGTVWAMGANGSLAYSYNAGSGIVAPPTLDVRRDELYVATEDGVLHLLKASNGQLRWRKAIGGAVTTPPVLTNDAVYVATDGDAVVAFKRRNGEVLWRYRREAPEGFYISGHAGLTLAEGRILAAFTSGVVVSLDAGDGSLRWERDTSTELEPGPDGTPRFADVDTTPLVIGDTLYIASFAGGLYALELISGSVRWRDEELTGVVDIVPAGDRMLVMASGDLGVVCMDRVDREVLWRRRLPRGAPAGAVVAQDLVLFGESQGGFITLGLASGRELGRIETGHGFSARAAIADGRGFVLSNGGTLYAFALPGSR